MNVQYASPELVFPIRADNPLNAPCAPKPKLAIAVPRQGLRGQSYEELSTRLTNPVNCHVGAE